MDQTLPEFFADYTDLVQIGDTAALRGYFDTPFVHLGPFGSCIYDDIDPYLDQVAELQQHYARCGTVAYDARMVGSERRGPAFIQADLSWRLVDRRGQAIAEGSFSHLVRLRGRGYRIAMHITHDEPFQRPQTAANGPPSLRPGYVAA